jgi:hypothetical protein
VTILGIPRRTVQQLAKRGKLPGAAKFGRRWTFDIAKLRRLVRDQERRAWRENEKHLRDAIGAAVPSTVALRSTGETSDGRFTQ